MSMSRQAFKDVLNSRKPETFTRRRALEDSGLDSVLNGVRDVMNIVSDFLDERVLVEVWNKDRQVTEVLSYSLTFHEFRLVHAITSDQQAIFSSDRISNKLIGVMDFKEQMLQLYGVGENSKPSWTSIKGPPAKVAVEVARDQTEIIPLVDTIECFLVNETWQLDLKKREWRQREQTMENDMGYGCSNLDENRFMRLASDGNHTIISHDAYDGGNPMTRYTDGEDRHEVAKIIPDVLLPPSCEDLRNWEELTIAVWSRDTQFLFGGYIAPDNVLNVSVQQATTNTMLRYDWSNKEYEGIIWSTCAPLPFTSYHNLSQAIAVTSDALYVFQSVSAVWKYDVGENVWSEIK